MIMKKGQGISRGCSLAFWFTTIISVSANPKPYPFEWNTTHSFGYDGPWHAIPMKIGWPEQIINLYPGGTWASVILGSNLSDSFKYDYPNQTWLSSSEVWNAAKSEPTRPGSTENYDIAQSNRGGVTGSLDGSWRGSDASNITGDGIILTDRMTFETPDNGVTIPNISISALYEANMGFPDGSTVPMDVGFLSLGARAPQTFGNYTANVISEYLASDERIPSNSWSLHIGSVAKGIAGSLILGGYDSSRAVGDVGTYDTTDGFGGMFANLVDIQMGISGDGGSPWAFRNKTNLLRNAKNNTQSISVRPNPTAPFLFLPNQTCETIASYLPVTWQWDLGLYTWNTDDPRYEQILTSPSYLDFVFQRSSGQSNLNIKVPLALLNLTLTSPIVDTPTAYFPCRPFDNDGAEYHLGRAFLQAAFIGMNWVNSKWWMAQAPGPGSLTSSIITIENNTESLSTTAPSTFWADSWKRVLTDLPNPSSSTNSSSDSNNNSGSGISGGAIAGAVVGSTVGGLALLAGAVFFFLRTCRAIKPAAAPSSDDQKEAYFPDRQYPMDRQQRWPVELAGGEPVHEIMTTSTPPQELMTTGQPPQELMANEDNK